MESCEHLKIFEFKTIVNLNLWKRDRDDVLLSNLQTFKFKPKDKNQLKFVKELFSENSTHVVALN